MTPRKIEENFIATLVDDEVVLIDMAGGELFSLKGTARAIWDKIDGRNSRAGIVEELSREYDVEAIQAEADVSELLEALGSARLISC